jgi:hypothetical protein
MLHAGQYDVIRVDHEKDSFTHPLAASFDLTAAPHARGPVQRDAVCVLFFVFDLSCFAGLVRGLGLVLDLATCRRC